MKTYALYTIHINNSHHITRSAHHNQQKLKALIINDLSAKTHETTGNKPATPEITYQKYPY